MPTTKICQLNNTIQWLLEDNNLDSCPASILSSDYIPESILKDSYRRPGLRYAEWQPCYPLTRLIRQGKIEGALPFAEQALSSSKAIFGKDDLNVAILHDHLAAL